MSYYFSKQVNSTFEQAIEAVTASLKMEGFGILSDIDVKQTFKKKLDVDFRNYRILGACNPSFAYKALQAEENIGTMLPCNVIVQENQDGTIRVAAINPLTSMQSVNNPGLSEIAGEVADRLQRVVDNL